jgi:hypothetical protein
MNTMHDTRLIAAASDLLAALRPLVWQLDRMDDLPDEVEQMIAIAKAAIAKAEEVTP